MREAELRRCIVKLTYHELGPTQIWVLKPRLDTRYDSLVLE